MLSIDSYIKDVGRYNLELDAKNQRSIISINKIFADEQITDVVYATKLAESKANLEQINKYIDGLANSINPQRGKLTKESIASIMIKSRLDLARLKYALSSIDEHYEKIMGNSKFIYRGNYTDYDPNFKSYYYFIKLNYNEIDPLLIQRGITPEELYLEAIKQAKLKEGFEMSTEISSEQLDELQRFAGILGSKAYNDEEKRRLIEQNIKGIKIQVSMILSPYSPMLSSKSKDIIDIGEKAVDKFFNIATGAIKSDEHITNGLQSVLTRVTRDGASAKYDTFDVKLLFQTYGDYGPIYQIRVINSDTGLEENLAIDKEIFELLTSKLAGNELDFEMKKILPGYKYVREGQK